MNQDNLYTILIIAILAAWLIIKHLNTAGIPKISPLDAKKKLDTVNGIILLDVRTKSEYLEKRIPKSILIPVNVLQNEGPQKLPDKNTEIIVYCRSGNRSVMAVKILLKLGYKHVYNLGGITRWPYETLRGNR